MWRFVTHRFIVSSLAHAPVASAAPGRRGDRARAVAAALGVALMAGCDPVISPRQEISDAASTMDIRDAPPGPDATQVCTQACISDHDLRECKADGSDKTVWCPLGCVMNAEARCRSIVPSNGVNPDDLMGTSKSLYIPEGAQAIIDTDSGLITVKGETWREAGVGVKSGVRFRYTADDLSVFAASGLNMQPGSMLRACGERPLLILTNGYVEIWGTIDVSAGSDLCASPSTSGGPGGGRGADGQNPATGCGPGGNGGVSMQGAGSGGGGGGSPGQAGAAGASAQEAAGGSGGEACEASVAPLRGGSGGGRAGIGHLGNDEGDGGGGGGALQIVSLSFSIQLEGSAAIDAGGRGGRGGAGGGGGGGAGGTILLEAPRVVIKGGARLAANGGGGGGESPGEDGRVDVAQAQGGPRGGGLGGALAGAPTAGTLRAGMFGGGGGGATGLIHLRAMADQCKIESAVVSPAAVCVEPETE